jgi:antitoxin (DNA-binding transcriptional repressor) of toxin-antitoxin stability system
MSHLAIAPVRQVNLHEAKTQLSRLVAEAVAGESFVICKAGKPLVQVTRLAGTDDPANPPRRRLGLLAGQCSVPDDFDQIAVGEIADLFEGLPAAAPSSSGL